MKGVSLIIITYNKREILYKSLKHIFENSNVFDELVLVDNGSVDGTSEMIKREFPQVKLIKLHKNKGVTEGRNIGAVNASFEFLFFYDDDARFDFYSLPPMVKLLEESKDVAIADCQLINLPLEDIFNLDIRSFRSNTYEKRNIHLFKGGACIIKKNVFFKLGMYPDAFFYCCEEGDLSYRLFKKGYRIVHFNSSNMLHKKSNAKSDHKRLLFYRYRNKLYQIWRNLPMIEAVKGTILLFCSGFITGLFNMNYITIAKGFVVGLIGLPKIILYQRHPMSRNQFKEYKRAYKQELNITARIKNLKKSINFWRFVND